MLSRLRLSLCMIVKDEEEFIGSCLKSIKDAVDEIIIVDTGCTDKTIEICENYGSKVCFFPWNGNFSEARNVGLKRASGDWILWMDADEEIEKQDIPKIIKAMEDKDFDVYSMHLMNYYGETKDKDRVTQISHTRMFRNGLGLQFVNTIHEVLNTNEMIKNKDRIGLLDVKIHHYGYMDQVIQKKNKPSRNTVILENELKKEDKAWTRFYLASEYCRLKKYDQALQNINLAALRFIESGEAPTSTLYVLKYSILAELGRGEEALKGLGYALQIYPDYVELWFCKGINLYNLERYQEAIEAFDKCLELGDENLQYFIVKGDGSYTAWYYKGLCQAKLRRYEEALASFFHSLSISPQCSLARSALLDLLENHVEVNPNNP